MALTEAERIEQVIVEYRDEMLLGMMKYHGCMMHAPQTNGPGPCRADRTRVDTVIMPVVRKMLEDTVERILADRAVAPCLSPCPEARHLCGRGACMKSKGHGGDHACTGDWQTHTYA